MANDPIHPVLTRKKRYRYIFCGKHHGGGSPTDAQWSKDVTQDEEFSIFDEADFYDICEGEGWLYGVLRNAERELGDLGTWSQQIAEFPRANEGVPWHGYPIWPLNDDAPPNRSGEQMRPPKEVFQKMEQAGLINKRQRKRLFKGDHA